MSGYPDKLREKAAELVKMYQGIVDGEVLEFWAWGQWHDNLASGRGPDLGSVLSAWRFKPKPKPPRKRWTKVNKSGGEENCTEDPIRADQWREHGYDVVEWQEVRHE